VRFNATKGGEGNGLNPHDKAEAKEPNGFKENAAFCKCGFLENNEPFLYQSILQRPRRLPSKMKFQRKLC
jgi:hypothetical protein